jgi:hypothetical protein
VDDGTTEVDPPGAPPRRRLLRAEAGGVLGVDRAAADQRATPAPPEDPLAVADDRDGALLPESVDRSRPTGSPSRRTGTSPVPAPASPAVPSTRTRTSGGPQPMPGAPATLSPVTR